MGKCPSWSRFSDLHGRELGEIDHDTILRTEHDRDHNLHPLHVIRKQHFLRTAVDHAQRIPTIRENCLTLPPPTTMGSLAATFVNQPATTCSNFGDIHGNSPQITVMMLCDGWTMCCEHHRNHNLSSPCDARYCFRPDLLRETGPRKKVDADPGTNRMPQTATDPAPATLFGPDEHSPMSLRASQKFGSLTFL